MQKYIVLFAAFGAVLGASVDSRENEVNRDPDGLHLTFSCVGLPNSPLLNHPTDCSRFIQCDNGQAWDRGCAFCGPSINPQCLGENYLHFDTSVNDTACIWPKDRSCRGTPPITQTTPTTVTSTTETTTTTLVPGRPCNADNCTIEGECRKYRICERKSTNPADSTGTIVEKECEPKGTYYQPSDYTPNVAGSCVDWDNLDKDIQNQYLLLDGCTYCKITKRGDCVADYNYRNELGVTTIRSCKPAGHVFDENKQACVIPSVCDSS